MAYVLFFFSLLSPFTDIHAFPSFSILVSLSDCILFSNVKEILVQTAYTASLSLSTYLVEMRQLRDAVVKSYDSSSHIDAVAVAYVTQLYLSTVVLHHETGLWY